MHFFSSKGARSSSLRSWATRARTFSLVETGLSNYIRNHLEPSRVEKSSGTPLLSPAVARFVLLLNSEGQESKNLLIFKNRFGSETNDC
jgi:hypothetical protein